MIGKPMSKGIAQPLESVPSVTPFHSSRVGTQAMPLAMRSRAIDDGRGSTTIWARSSTPWSANCRTVARAAAGPSTQALP